MTYYSLWVRLLYVFARHSHQSCLIPWPTASECHCFISLLGTLINHVSSHDLQLVSDTALFLCQTLSSIMSCPMTNREWVTLLYLLQSGSSINHVSISLPITCPTDCKSYEVFYHSFPLILWQIVSEWYAIFIGHFFQYSKQFVSDPAFAFSHIDVLPMMTNKQQVCDTTTYWWDYILFHKQQEVGGIVPCVQSSSWNLILWQIEGPSLSWFWHITIPLLIFGRMYVFCMSYATEPYVSCPTTNRKWVEIWSCNFGVQAVSNFMSKRVSLSIVLDRLILAHPMTNR